MEYIKLSDFLKMEIKPFLLGAFLSRIMEAEIDGKKFFYAYSAFKRSKFVFKDDFDLKAYTDEYIKKLNRASGHHNWSKHKVTDSSTEVRFYIYNDLSMSKTAFYQILYRKTMSSFIYDEQMPDGKKEFIRGFIELRGSVDTTLKYISQDYFCDSHLELKKGLILTDSIGIPIQYANFNMRNLQPQFVSGEVMRNTQFRINLFYYASKIGFINDYKALIFEKAYKITAKSEKDGIISYFCNMPKPQNSDVTFVKMLNFYTNNIYAKKLTKQAIDKYRDELGFSNEAPESSKRNTSIVKLFADITEDKCALCGTEKTYTNPQTGRQQFEIHHFISFKNGQEVDNIANFVKLCPTCHSGLKKGAAPKEQQIKAILKILHERTEVFEFASSYLSISDINELAEKIQEMLG